MIQNSTSVKAGIAIQACPLSVAVSIRIKYSKLLLSDNQKAPISSVSRVLFKSEGAPPAYWFFQWLVTLYRLLMRHMVSGSSTQLPAVLEGPVTLIVFDLEHCEESALGIVSVTV